MLAPLGKGAWTGRRKRRRIDRSHACNLLNIRNLNCLLSGCLRVGGNLRRVEIAVQRACCSFENQPAIRAGRQMVLNLHLNRRGQFPL